MGFTSNSRDVHPGDTFFAFEGSKCDGHDFVVKAIENGASTVIIRRGHPKAAVLLEPGKDRIVAVENPRKTYAEMACEHFGYPSKKMRVCAVTGTSGKTTCTFLLESILNTCGEKTGLIGTIENRLGNLVFKTNLTTPDAFELQKTFQEYHRAQATAVAMEVSSHALDQWRVAGTKFSAALFTNLSQDHLDYHKTFETYFEAKARLFLDYLPSVCVIHTSTNYGKRLAKLCEQNGLSVIRVDREGVDVDYSRLQSSLSGISGHLRLGPAFRAFGQSIEIQSSLIGDFNIENIACTVAVALGLGYSPDSIGKGVRALKCVPGRLEKVDVGSDTYVFVDYAHKPDALQGVLSTLRKCFSGKLVCVFGCGGDRDIGKRPLMGKIAHRLADHVIVSNDNPRSEPPQKIIDDILKGMPDLSKVQVIPDRCQAIKAGLSLLKSEDCLLIAGKGHETYQIIGSETLPFDDREVVQSIGLHT